MDPGSRRERRGAPPLGFVTAGLRGAARLVACSLACLAGTALAAEAAGDSTWRSVLGFFTWEPRAPRAVEAALSAWERGRPLEAIAIAGEGLGSAPGSSADELHLVRGLALRDLGWRSLAVESLLAVAAAPGPGPYGPLAASLILDLEFAAGHDEAVVETWTRFVERPLEDRTPESAMRRSPLFAYGDLERAADRPTTDERALLASPGDLGHVLQLRRDRPLERSACQAGVARESSRILDPAWRPPRGER